MCDSIRYSYVSSGLLLLLCHTACYLRPVRAGGFTPYHVLVLVLLLMWLLLFLSAAATGAVAVAAVEPI